MILFSKIPILDPLKQICWLTLDTLRQYFPSTWTQLCQSSSSSPPSLSTSLPSSLFLSLFLFFLSPFFLFHLPFLLFFSFLPQTFFFTAVLIRFTAKMNRRYRDFAYTFCSHLSITYPIIHIPHQIVDLVQSMKIHYHIITQST